MSTKQKKLYSSRDIEQARADNEAVIKYFARKGEKRKTSAGSRQCQMAREAQRGGSTEKMVISFLAR
jgi:hypothetical protein